MAYRILFALYLVIQGMNTARSQIIIIRFLTVMQDRFHSKKFIFILIIMFTTGVKPSGIRPIFFQVPNPHHSVKMYTWIGMMIMGNTLAGQFLLY